MKNFLYLLHYNGEKYSCQHFILEIESKVLKVNKKSITHRQSYLLYVIVAHLLLCKCVNIC